MAGKARVSVAKIVDKKEHNVRLIKWRSRRRGRGKDATQEEAALHKAAPVSSSDAGPTRTRAGVQRRNRALHVNTHTHVRRTAALHTCVSS